MIKSALMVAALALAFASPVTITSAATLAPIVCTVLNHPPGCVEPAPVFVHSSTGFTSDKPCIPPADKAAVKAILHIT